MPGLVPNSDAVVHARTRDNRKGRSFSCRLYPCRAALADRRASRVARYRCCASTGCDYDHVDVAPRMIGQAVIPGRDRAGSLLLSEETNSRLAKLFFEIAAAVATNRIQTVGAALSHVQLITSAPPRFRESRMCRAFNKRRIVSDELQFVALTEKGIC